MQQTAWGFLGLVGVIALSAALALPAWGSSTLYVDADAAPGGGGENWATAYQYLQDALAAAAASGGTVTEIRVAGGTYQPDRGGGKTPGDRDATFQLLNGVALRGGYAGNGEPDPNARDIAAYETILSGDLAGDDRLGFLNNGENSYHVITATGTDSTAVLDGVSITSGASPGLIKFGSGIYIDGGSARFRDCTIRHNSAVGGGGLFVSQGSPELVGCSFRDNVAGRGAALSAVNSNVVVRRCSFTGNRTSGSAYEVVGIDGGTARIEDCAFVRNAVPAGSALYGSGTLNVIRCTFWRNNGRAVTDVNGMGLYSDCWIVENSTGAGGVVYVSAGQPRFRRCVFHGNRASYGGAIYASNAPIQVTNCRFFGNRADSVGAAIDMRGGVVTNSVFVGNRAGASGTLTCYGNVQVNHCTFSRNTSAEPGAAIRAQGSPGSSPVVAVSNSILWGNTAGGENDQAAQIYASSASVVLSNSNVQGLDGSLGGTGNIPSDPLFLDADGPDNVPGTLDDNVRLAQGSPCLDAASASLLPPDVADLDGDGDAVEPLPLDLDDVGRIVGSAPDMGAYEGPRPAMLIQP
ncbi:MAG: right-handed parallel beta-helix repeat-containing protein, partial [Planctomycetes bacterium]|nr:right-handed parallel beta-helix repeat-containing protein [Planctomycetota bacterium]